MARFVSNPHFLDELQREAEIRADLVTVAEAAQAKAEPLAPRIMPRGPDAFEVQQDAEGVYLVALDYGAAIAEWGSVNSPLHAPLRRGVSAIGLRLKDDSPKT